MKAAYDYSTLVPEVEARVEAVLKQMTLAEKVGQLWQVSPVHLAEEPLPAPSDLPQRTHLLEDLHAGRVGSLLNLADPAKANAYQRVAVEESRLGIPLLIGADVIHGFRTIFPIPLAEACTWNPQLLEQAAAVAATEASAVGINWTFAPVVDIGRDPRRGRVAEGAGEDVHLTSTLAAARVRGFQATLPTRRQVAACPKHFAAYGAAEAGRDYNTADLSERTLRDVYLPPFKAAFEAGAGSVMLAFNELAGMPAHANEFIMRAVLRDEWRWPGVTLSDYEGVLELVAHGSAADLNSAACQSMQAGLDIEMVSSGYDRFLAELVERGEVPLTRLNEAVSRVLRLKLRLGLFEHPYVDEEHAESWMLRSDARTLALDVARQSVVLLKNAGGLLPLKPGRQRVAVIGPLASAKRALLGCWTLFGQARKTPTILEALQRYQAPASVVAGCDVKENVGLDLAGAIRAAQQADVVVLVVGEDDSMSGEARSRIQLTLPGQQHALAEAVMATATPVITVLLSGRPLAVPALVQGSAALLTAWHGGTCAGQAVADLLYGVACPSGKLASLWPRSVGQLPMTYAHKSTGRPDDAKGAAQFGEPFKSRYIDESNAPLFPFGFGLSYANFEFSDLEIQTPQLREGETLRVQVTLRNIGSCAGAEVAQLYIRDLVGSVTRPVRELKAFKKTQLEAGETRRLGFEVPTSALAFWRKNNTYGTEPGEFQLWVGPDSVSGLTGRFHLLAGGRPT